MVAGYPVRKHSEGQRRYRHMRSVHRRESLGVQEDASHIFQFPFPGKGDSAASSCVGRSLVDLGFRAHLFPDRLAQPAERYPQLAMDTHPRPAQRSFDHSGTIYRQRPSGIAFRPPSAARCFRAKPQPIDRTGGDEDNAQSANPPEDRPSRRALRVSLAIHHALLSRSAFAATTIVSFSAGLAGRPKIPTLSLERVVKSGPLGP
jgi:hypothetical protein